MKAGKVRKSILLIFDIFLLIATPALFDIGAAVLFGFLYPLPAILIAVFAGHLKQKFSRRISNFSKIVAAVTKVMLSIIIIVTAFFGELHSSIGIVSFILLTTPFIQTYNRYFSLKYNKTFAEKTSVYVLEFYIFILGYICLIIAGRYLFGV